MTRINVGYPVEKLTTKHLIAEHREIKRIPNTISSGKAVIRDIPKRFTLGKGHVKFFYNKCQYLLDRYNDLYTECKRRNYNVQNYSSAWSGVPNNLMNNYEPTEHDKQIIRDRISQKLSTQNPSPIL